MSSKKKVTEAKKIVKNAVKRVATPRPLIVSTAIRDVGETKNGNIVDALFAIAGAIERYCDLWEASAQQPIDSNDLISEGDPEPEDEVAEGV